MPLPPAPDSMAVMEMMGGVCVPGRLFHNDRGLGFSEVNYQTIGLTTTTSIGGHAVVWGDVEGDGDQDLFVGSIYAGESKLYINQWRESGTQTATFTEAALAPESPTHVTGCAFVDWDHDGDQDLAISRHTFEPSVMLYENDGNGEFARVDAEELGIVDQGTSANGITALDFEDDGREDLLVLPQGENERVHLFSQLSDGLFTDMGGLSGILAGRAACAVAEDYNGDHLPDIYLGRSESMFYTNQTGTANHWVTVRLRGGGLVNRDAIGVRVEVDGPAGTIVKQISGGGGRAWSSGRDLHFGLGDWPSGSVTARVDWGYCVDTHALEVDSRNTLEEDADPTIDDGSLTMSVVVGGPQMDWVFEWNTPDSTIAGLDCVQVTQENCGCGGSVLLDDSNATVEITRNLDGTFHHKVTWGCGCCIPNCSVKYKARSAVLTRSDWSIERTKIQKFCAIQ